MTLQRQGPGQLLAQLAAVGWEFVVQGLKHGRDLGVGAAVSAAPTPVAFEARCAPQAGHRPSSPPSALSGALVSGSGLWG